MIHTNDDTEVWGALYELQLELIRRSDGERSVLDRIEGHRTSVHPKNYDPIVVTVEWAGREVAAWTYVACATARERFRRDHAQSPVGEAYVQSIIDAADALGLPQPYLNEIENSRRAGDI
jgi:AIG2-like family